MIHYLWWVPLTILYYIGFAKLSHLTNTEGGRWPLYLYLYGAAAPMWALISRISSNLIVDGVIYDTLMALTFVVTLIILGEGAKFSTLQWAGVALIIIGITLVKI